MPIIAPVVEKHFEILERKPLQTVYSSDFLAGLMGNPELIRNIAIVGHLHHGKTTVGGMQRLFKGCVSMSIVVMTYVFDSCTGDGHVCGADS